MGHMDERWKQLKNIAALSSRLVFQVVRHLLAERIPSLP